MKLLARVIPCKNPACRKLFRPDAEHRFGGTCSPECQAAITSRHRSEPPLPVDVPFGVSRSESIPVQRKHGKDRRE